MKNIFLPAAALAMAISANAQYQVDPGMDHTIGNNAEVFDVFVLDATTVSNLKAQGKTVHEYFIDDVTRHWYWWDGWSAGDGSYPGVDFQMDGYISQTVTGTAGWSGGGLAVNAPGIDLSHINDDTHFHAAFRSDNCPSSIAVILLDGESDCGSIPAKLSVGNTPFVDNGAVYPLVADFDREGGDWVGVDIKFGDLKRLWPVFSPAVVSTWTGNALSILSGNVAGQNFSLDAFYLYSTNGAGIDDVDVDAANFVVTANTINLAGAEEISLYDLTGREVRKANGSVMGIDDMDHGIYIVKSGNATKKIRL